MIVFLITTGIVGGGGGVTAFVAEFFFNIGVSSTRNAMMNVGLVLGFGSFLLFQFAQKLTVHHDSLSTPGEISDSAGGRSARQEEEKEKNDQTRRYWFS